MNKLFFSIVFGFIVLGGLMIFQATRSGTAAVLLPSELLAQTTDVSRVRVAGRVSNEQFEYALEPTIKLSFSVVDPGKGSQPVPVVYHGLKPDMFAAGRDVIIDGSYAAGTIRAHSLLTQCPSKYEPPDPEGKYGVTSSP